MNKRLLKSYRIWKAMKARCYAPSQTRGYYQSDHIKVCERWLHSYENFMEDMGPIPGDDYSIERIDIHRDYCPENCKWILQKDQSKNRRNTIYAIVDGEKVCLKEAARKLQMNYYTLYSHYRKQKTTLIFYKEGKQMKAFSNYDKTQAYSEGNRLPVGGYVLKIMNVKEEAGQNGNSGQLVVAFDVAEGDQAGFYQKNYAAQTGEDKKWKGSTRLWIPKDDGSEQDEWTKRKFKTFIVSVEDSNDGYHWDWDETKLKGKIVGGVFNEKEWEFNGNSGFFTNLHHFTTAEKIRANEFKIPDPTYLKNRQQASAPIPNEFVDVKPGDPEEIPF